MLRENTQPTSVAVPQSQTPSITLSIKELSAERRCFTYPQYQRQKAWNMATQQALVDTILRGDPVAHLEGYCSHDELSQPQWRISDGRQRITTVLEFVDGMFKTWTVQQKKCSEPDSEPPVEPGKYFHELSPRAQNAIMQYHFHLYNLHSRTQREEETRFKRTQNHAPLSSAEKLYIHASKAKDIALVVQDHPFWKRHYTGKTNRGQLYQSSLYLLGVEIASPKITVELLSMRYSHKLAYGGYDDKLLDSTLQAILDRLSTASFIYADTKFSMRSIIIPMYQTALYLDRAGYTIKPEDRGKLTPWITNIMYRAAQGSITPNYAKPLQLILREQKQIEFWTIHLKSVMAYFGLSVEEGMEIRQQPIPIEAH